MQRKEYAENFKPEGYPETAFQKAKQIWDDRIGNSREQAKNWRIFSLVTLGLSFFLGLILLVEINKNKIVPYVIEIQDQKARTVGKATEYYKPTQELTKFFLSEFITSIRTISSDPIIVKRNWLKAYNFLSSTAGQQMNEIAKKNNPFDLVGKVAVTPQIESVTVISDSSYQIEWSEDIFALQGSSQQGKKFTAILTVKINPPKTEEELLRNPLGIYIDSINISEKFK